MTILEGRSLAAAEVERSAKRADALRAAGVIPTLAVIAFGDDAAASSYRRSIRRTCEKAGVELVEHLSDSATASAAAEALVRDVQSDSQVHGVMVQTPLPPQLSATQLFALIAPEKDIDGANPTSLGRLVAGLPTHVPATAAAVMCLVRASGITLSGSEAVVIGRSLTVGKPVAALLLAENATVTTCHSRTADLADVARRADILVVAMGKPAFVDRSFVKDGAVVVDVGINPAGDKIVGDVDAGVAEHAVLTPVPGGVGPLTNVMLIANLLDAAEGLREAPH